MEVPGELKSDLHRALLGPLSLATEFFGALLPGCVLLTLICIKRGWVTLLLSYPLLGYKTKVIVALFAAYLAGKATMSLVTQLRQLAMWIAKKRNELKERSKPAEKNFTVLQMISDLISKAMTRSTSVASFVAGFVGAPMLTNKSQMMDVYTAHENAVYFHLNTGLVLFICSLVPGDGGFRIAEGTAGVIFLVGGIREALAGEALVAGLLGAILNSYLVDLKPEQVSAGMKSAWTVFSVLSKTPVPPTSVSVTPTSPTSSSPSAIPTPASSVLVTPAASVS